MGLIQTKQECFDIRGVYKDLNATHDEEGSKHYRKGDTWNIRIIAYLISLTYMPYESDVQPKESDFFTHWFDKKYW